MNISYEWLKELIDIPYTPDELSKIMTAQGMTVDGAAVALTAYNIDGSNYFALRELGGVLGFTVGYDEASRTIRITTG